MQRVQRVLAGLLALPFLSFATESSHNDPQLSHQSVRPSLVFVQAKAARWASLRAEKNDGPSSEGRAVVEGHLMLDRNLPNMVWMHGGLKTFSVRMVDVFLALVCDILGMTYQRLGLRTLLVVEENRAKSSTNTYLIVFAVVVVVGLFCFCALLEEFGEQDIGQNRERFGQRFPRKYERSPQTTDMRSAIPLNAATGATGWQTGQHLPIKEAMPLSSFSEPGVHPAAASEISPPAFAAVVGASAPQAIGTASTDRTSVWSPSVSSRGITSQQHVTATPLCPDCVSSFSSFYSISFDALANTREGNVPIHGRDQQRLLTAHIRRDGLENGSVALTTGDSQGYVLGSIKHAKGILTISDMMGRTYGDLRESGQLAYSLICGTTEVLKFAFNEKTVTAHFTSPNGAYQAHATRMSGVEDCLGIEVAAGVDPVLVLLCIVGAISIA